MNEELKADLNTIQTKHKRWERYQHLESKAHLKPSSEETEELFRLQRDTEYHTKILESVQALQDKSLRKIGHIAYHSTFGTSFSQLGYLKDWALVEMDPAKFSHGPENKVLIADSPDRSEFRLAISSTSPKRNDANTNARKKGFLDLRLPEPGEEITEPRHVGMRGSSSGLTFGQTSGIEAVLREPMKDGTSLYTWELLVIPEGEKIAFSRRGDFGSCVFDLEGRVVGILVGSSEEDPDEGKTAWRGVASGSNGPHQQKAHPGHSIRPEDATETDGLPRLWKAAIPVDVSFVSPIKWVLEDIQGFTGFRPRLS